jgi:integrase
MNPAQLYVLSLGSKTSRDGTHRKLSQIAAMQKHSFDSYAWGNLSPLDVQHILAQLEDQGLSFSSINAYLSALKGVAREAWRLGLLDGERLSRIKDIPNRRGFRLPAGQALIKDDVDIIIQTALNNVRTATAKRNAAILALGFYLGLRRAEIGSLKLNQLDLVMGSLRVIGKGNKEREIPIPIKVIPYLNNWLIEREKQVIDYKVKGDFLFGSMNKADKIMNLSGISGNVIFTMIKKTALTSGIHFSTLPTPHDMRRTAVTNWLECGDPRVAQALAGHEHIQTTMSYSRTDLTDKMRNVIEKQS